MPKFKLTQNADSTWEMQDKGTGAELRLLPYRELQEWTRYSFKRYTFKNRDFNCFYGIHSSFMTRDANGVLLTISSFTVQSAVGEDLSRQRSSQAYLDNLSQLTDFFTNYERLSGRNRNVRLKCGLSPEFFYTLAEERDEHIKLMLGIFHSHLIKGRALLQLTLSANLDAMCEKTNLCSPDFDLRYEAIEKVSEPLDDFILSSILETWNPVKNREFFESLYSRWLDSTISETELYQKLILQHLQNNSRLPEKELYISKYYNELRPLMKKFDR